MGRKRVHKNTKGSQNVGTLKSVTGCHRLQRPWEQAFYHVLGKAPEAIHASSMVARSRFSTHYGGPNVMCPVFGTDSSGRHAGRWMDD